MAPDPHLVMDELDKAAKDYDSLSKLLSEAEERIAPLNRWYELVVEQTAVDLWDQYTTKKITRLPGEDVRLALAHREMRGTEDGARNLAALGDLRATRKRLMREIDEKGRSINARQSILSALKEELRAVGA